jgi:hypothetical protein
MAESATREQDCNTHQDHYAEDQDHAQYYMPNGHDHIAEPVRLNHRRLAQLELRTANRAPLLRSNRDENYVLPAFRTKGHRSVHKVSGGS